MGTCDGRLGDARGDARRHCALHLLPSLAIVPALHHALLQAPAPAPAPAPAKHLHLHLHPGWPVHPTARPRLRCRPYLSSSCAWRQQGRCGQAGENSAVGPAASTCPALSRGWTPNDRPWCPEACAPFTTPASAHELVPAQTQTTPVSPRATPAPHVMCSPNPHGSSLPAPPRWQRWSLN